MSKSTKVTLVGPAAVRALFHNGTLDASKVTVTKTVKGEPVTAPVNDACLTAGPQGKGRGRVNKAFVAAALAHLDKVEGGTHTYAEKVESTPTIEVPLFDKRDRRTGRKATIALSEFRALSGQEKGRPSSASVEKAGRAVSAARRKG